MRFRAVKPPGSSGNSVQIVTNNIERRPIPDYPGAWVSSDGCVWKQAVGGAPMRSYASPRGYLTVTLKHKSGERRTKGIHQLVGMAFLKGQVGYVVDHIDRNKHNNRLENLRYVTKSENAANTDLSKTTPESFHAIRADIAGGMTYSECARKHNLTPPSVRYLCAEIRYQGKKYPAVEYCAENAKTSAEKEKAILVDVYAGKLSQTAIAKKHGVSSSLISKLKKGRGTIGGGNV